MCGAVALAFSDAASLSMFALIEPCVSDLAQLACGPAQIANMAPVDFVGADVEVLVAQRRDARQHGVDVGFGGNEGVKGCGVVFCWAGGHGCVPCGELHRFRVINFARSDASV
jgi:hypothetical protein